MRLYNTIGRQVVVAGAITLLSAPSMAADPAATIETAPIPYNWSGFYTGVHGGYGWGDANAIDPTVPDQEPEGGFGGIQIGYDYQLPNNFVFGVVGDLSFGEIGDSVLNGTVLRQSGEVDYSGTVRGKLGYAVDRFLPYVTAGFAWAHSEASIACPTGFGAGVCSLPAFEGQSRSDDTIATGWTAGVGLAYAFTDNWSAEVEYLYADFGTNTFDLDIFGEGEAESTLNTVKLGINYRF